MFVNPSALVPSINIWYHEPSILDLVFVEFLHVPLLCGLSSKTQVDRDKGQTSQHRLVDHLAWRSGQQGEGQVDDALCAIVWANNGAEDRVIRESVFLQGKQEVVEVMLQTRGDQEQRHAEESPQAGGVGDLHVQGEPSGQHRSYKEAC